MATKGRILPEDEDTIQRCTPFIEREVEAKDLTPDLFSAKIFDIDDRNEIDCGETQVLRIRRFLEKLLMRGPYAFREFTKSLKRRGYAHVAVRLASVALSSENMRAGTGGSLNEFEHTGASANSTDPRLDIIERLLEQLCQRVTQLEESNTPGQENYIPEDELFDIKSEVNDLKTATMSRIKKLLEEGEEKDEQIAELTSQLELKQMKLEEAEQRILDLEDRIKDLESVCIDYKKNIEHLNKQERYQADRLSKQERRLQVQAEKLQKQEKKNSELEKKVKKQQEENETNMEEMNRKVNRMSTVMESMLANDGRMKVVGRLFPQPNLKKQIKPKRK